MIASRVTMPLPCSGIFNVAMLTRSRNPRRSASLMKGSFMIVNCEIPFEMAASRSGFPPAGTILTSFSGSMPSRRKDSRSPISEILPKRLTEPILPRNCSAVVMLGCADNMVDESRNDRQNHHRIGAAEPGINHIGRGRDDDIEIACDQRLHRRGPAPKKIDSTDKPCFAKNPFSCATQSGVCEAVIAAQPTRTRS